ncbi:MAG TPA: hypothetical protein PK916_16825 [Bacteroidota bacterium]|nr:hypothetical protein [Bacteroidota bacterium]
MFQLRKIRGSELVLLLLYALAGIDCTGPSEPNVTMNPEIMMELRDVGYDYYSVSLVVKSRDVVDVLVVHADDTLCHLKSSLVDTIITKASLQPSSDYMCRLVVVAACGKIDTSSFCVHTKDTVSCMFTWSSYSIGRSASIIEDLYEAQNGVIGFVGEFIDDTFWNYVELVDGALSKKKIPFMVNVLGVPRELTQVRITAVYRSNEADMWYGCKTGSVTRKYGDSTRMYYSEDTGMGWVTSIDGIEGDIYFTTTTGIYVYKNEVISLIYKPDAGSFVDAWQCGETLYAITSGRDLNEDASTVVKIKHGIVEVIAREGMRKNMQSIWTADGSKIYCAGGYLLMYDGVKWYQDNDLSRYFIEKIRGTSYDNIVLAGHGGTLEHYNGFRWNYIPNVPDLGVSIYNALLVCEDHIVVAGCTTSAANILIGRLKH